MAILGGLFSKKHKSKSKPASSITSSIRAPTDFDIESLNDESDYDHSHLHPNTVYQNPAASSSKMGLPFSKSRSKVNLPSTDTSSSANLPNSPLFGTQSEPLTNPLTPPQKSATFGVYGDSGSALSSKSLPDVTHARSESHETVKTTIPASAGKKSGRGLFSWARDRKKSKAPPPRPPESKEESFNLRAFRHVSGPGTTPSTPGLDDTTVPLDLPPARPRPRGDSVASDTSQRVSVATFREVHARRSQAGSPIPQPTSRPSTQIDGRLRSASPSLKPPASSIPNPKNQPRSRNVAPHIPQRTSTLRTSPSNPKSDSDSDSDRGPSPFSVRWGSKSELGHSALSDHRTSNRPLLTSPPLRQGRTTSDASRPVPPMPVSVHAPARPAAIQSRPSSRPLVQNVPASAKNTCRYNPYLSYAILLTICAAKRPVRDNDTSDSSDNSSEDDAPLATLVQPRRPGSATSNASGRSLPSKPLIDIKSLSNSPLSNTPVVPPVNSSPPIRSATPTGSRNDARSPTNINERLSNLTQGLTRPKPTPTLGSDPAVKSDGHKISPVTTGRTAPSRSATAPPETFPPVEKRPPAPLAIDKENSPSPKLPTNPTPDTIATSPSVNTTEFPTFTTPRGSLSLDDPAPIKPTPIHHRTPQSGFSVMSRPQHNHTPNSSVSTVLSANSVEKHVEKDGEPLDSIGDFTAAMFSQLDLGFSIDEGRESSEGTIKKRVITTTTTKVTAPSSAIPSKPTSPVPGPTTRTVNHTSNTGKREPAAPTRPVPSNAPSSRPHTPASGSATSRRSLRRPRSSTLVITVPPEDEPQPQPAFRPQPPRSVKSTPDVSGSRKTTKASRPQSPPLASQHKRVPSTVSTSSESSDESSSSAPSIAPRKQKQPLPQSRPQRPTSRPRSVTMHTHTLSTAIPPSPTSSSTHSHSPAFDRPPQRPFAMRENSPSSSTGDSSSGRLPITPRDGSEIGSELGRGIRGKRQPIRPTESLGVGNDGLLSVSNSEMGLKARKLAHRKSASYDDSTLKAAMRGGSGVAGITNEQRQRERRRSEAKNAIEVRPQFRALSDTTYPGPYVARKSHEREHQVGR